MSAKTKNIIRIAALFLLLMLPILYALATAIDLEYSWLKKAVYLAVVWVFLLIPALFLKARTYFIVEGIFNFFFFPIDIASLYIYHQPTSTAFLGSIIRTDIHEASELLLSIWPICIVVVALWILYFVLAIQVDNNYLLGERARKTLYISIASLAVVGFFFMLGFQKYMFPTKSTKLMAIDAVDAIRYKFYKIYPYNLYVELRDIVRSNAQQRRLQKEVSSFRFGITPKQPLPDALYMVVIGETARYDHFGINGYTRNTTPCLSQHAHLISFDSVYSQANLTFYSIPTIITRATVQAPEVAYKEKSLPEAFQEAGYRTGFISKQTLYPLTGRIMTTCDDPFLFPVSIDADGSYDIEIVDKMREYKTDTSRFVLIHSLGSHFRYEQRYPEEFKRFQPTLGKTFNYAMVAKENKDKLVNSYDNSILYTDYFLSELIDYADSLDIPAVMLFISDHGESFWDNDNNLSLHGAYVISEYEYHVPLFIWYSDEYAALYPDKVAAMQQNKTTPVSSDVVFYSMLDLAGIEDIVDSTRSVASPYLLPMDTIWVQLGTGSIEQMSLR